ncbi:DUF4344 domain-containing metallopeptidase [Devosia sp.]|uniref:DUF4344 domain-containing metallopeptidase n=1 Tax=Devosia sp. TaxID=1871048 RepID=UPI003263CA49
MTRILAALLGGILLCSSGHVLAQDYTDAQRGQAMDFAISSATQVLYHEIGHLFVAEFGLPVLGKNEDTADNIATLMLLEGGEDFADQVLYDAAQAWYLSPFNGDNPPDDATLIDEHSLDKQRAFSIVCLMVGNSPEYYAQIATDYGLDADRQQKCGDIYRQSSASWASVLEPNKLGDRELVGTITVTYEDPGDYTAEMEAMQADQFLDYAAQVVSENYLLPRDLQFKATQCGTANAFYSSGDSTLTFCYEFIRHLAELYLSNGMAEDDAGAGEDDEAE